MSNTNAEYRLRQEMQSGERLLWSGVPRQGVVWRPQDWLLTPFSLLWAGFAFSWEAGVLASPKAPVFFMLWGIPFIGMGLYISIGRFYADSYVRRRTVYGLSNRRIILLREWPTRQLVSLPLAQLPHLTLEERADGCGSIIFGPDFRGRRRDLSLPSLGNRFELIAQARLVQQQIEAAQARAISATP